MAFWILFFTYLGSFVLSELLRPKPNIENARPAGEDDFSFPTASESRHVPILVGKAQIQGPNVVWYGDIEANPITDNVSVSLFSSKTIITGYEYFAAIQMALCRGPCDEITKVWHGERIVFDRYSSPAIGQIGSPSQDILISEDDLFGGEDRNGGINGRMEVFLGATDAAVSSFLAARTIPTPNYQNTCYVLWRDGVPVNSQGTLAKAGGYIGNSPTVKPFKFEITRYPNNLGLLSSEYQIGDDANPIEFLYEILTDTDWGLGISDSQINLNGTLEEGGLIAVAQQIASEGLGFSAVFESPKTARELINEIERHVDGFFRLNITTGLFEIVLARSPTMSPDNATVIDENNILDLKHFSRGTWSETENELRLTFTDRDKNYTETHALAQDMANRLVQGRAQSQLRFPGVKTATVANKIVWRELRSMAFPLAKIQFEANRELYAIQAGSVLRWSWADYGITDLRMRVIRVDYGTEIESRLTIDAVEDVYDLETTAFVDPPTSGWIAPSTDAIALASDEQRLIQLPLALMSDDHITGQQQVGVLAVRPSGLHTGYQILKGTNGSETESNYTILGEVAQFTPSGVLVASIDRKDPYGGDSPQVSIRIDNTSQIDQLSSAVFSDLDSGAVNLALIDDEYFFFESVIEGSPSGTYVLTNVRRGLLNSVPDDHSAGARVWFVTNGMGLLSTSTTQTSFTLDDSFSVKLLTKTVIDKLAFASATRMDADPVSTADLDTSYYEFDRAYPANDVFLNGRRLLDYGRSSPENLAAGPLSFTWKGRNRNRQIVGDVGLDIDENDASVAPDATVLARIRVYRTDRSPHALVHTVEQIPYVGTGVSPESGIYNIDPDLYLIANPRSPLGSPETDYPKRLEVAIDIRDVGTIDQPFSQELREQITVTGYGLDFGENYGGVADSGVNLAQDDPPTAVVPIPGLENYREWRITVSGTLDTRDTHVITFSAFNNLTQSAGYDGSLTDLGEPYINIDGSVQSSLTEVREYIVAQLRASLDSIFVVDIDGNDVVIFSLYGSFTASLRFGYYDPGATTVKLRANTYNALEMQEAAPTTTGDEVLFKGYYFIDWYEEAFVQGQGNIDVLSPVSDDVWGYDGTYTYEVGISALTYDKQLELGFDTISTIQFSDNADVTPPGSYSGTFADAVQKLNNSPVASTGADFSVTRLDHTGSGGGVSWSSANPMYRNAVVMQLDVNLRGPDSIVRNSAPQPAGTNPALTILPYRLVWKENKQPTPSYPGGAEQINWFNFGVNVLNIDSDYQVEVEIDGTVYGPVTLGSPAIQMGFVNLTDLRNNLATLLDGVSGFSSVVVDAGVRGTQVELRKDTANSVSDVRLYAGFGLRLYVQEST